jgi:hypothetical protein
MSKNENEIVMSLFGCNTVLQQDVSTLSVEMQMCAIHDFPHAQVRASYDRL